MLPPIHGPCKKLAALDISIGNSWSDEELVRFLAERKAKDPLPGDVLPGVDCSMLDPWCTESLWCLKWSDDQDPDDNENGIRKTKNGYWKLVDSSKIPTGTSIMGAKIVSEFYEGYAPCGTKTGWMMHEYQVQQNDEVNLPQDYKSLCKVYMQSDKNAESGESSLNANAPKDSLESYLQYLARIEEPKDNIVANEQDTFKSTGQHQQNPQNDADDMDGHDVIAMGDYIEMNDLLISSCKEQHEQKTGSAGDYIEMNDLLISSYKEQHEQETGSAGDYIEMNDLLISSCKEQHEQETGSAADDIAVHDNISTDDYIELNDLLNSEVSSSTSENTSKRSMISEEYFDSDVFLKEILEDSNTPDGQHENHKFSIAAPTKSANVVVCSSEQGLLHIHGVSAAVAGPSQQKRVPGGDRDQHSSMERQQNSSSISSCFPNRHVKRSHSDGSDSSQSSMKSQGMRPTSKFGKIGKKYFCFRSF